MAKTKRFIVHFFGDVQGVGFRMTCISEATDLMIDGFVRNESDGSVKMDIDAAPRDAEELIRRIKIARKAYIDSVVLDEQPSMSRNCGFQIKA